MLRTNRKTMITISFQTATQDRSVWLAPHFPSSLSTFTCVVLMIPFPSTDPPRPRLGNKSNGTASTSTPTMPLSLSPSHVSLMPVLEPFPLCTYPFLLFCQPLESLPPDRP